MPVTVEQLCARHKVDVDHARHVAAQSLALFDALPAVHKLPAKRRRLLETAAVLHNIGFNANPARHHAVGRDLIRADTLSGYTVRERDILACTTRFHRKKVNPEKEPVFQGLSAGFQRQTLALAALLRIGDALDDSQTQTTAIASVERVGDAVRVVIEGEHAEENGARATRKADLWNRVFKIPVEIGTAAQFSEAVGAAEEPRAAGRTSRAKSHVLLTESPGLRADDPAAAAARKAMRLHFEHMVKNEAGARSGKDIEALHQMRVASRRLRAVLRCLGPFLPPKQVKRLRAALRRMTRALGPVRDLDVHLEMARRFRKTLSEDRRKTFEPLMKTWRNRRKAARQEMLDYLEGKPYESLKKVFRKALRAKPKAPEGRPASNAVPSRRPPRRLLGHVTPAILWRRYEIVRSYETLLDGASVETIHALRIDIKQLRYALELLEEVLGEAGSKLLAVVKAAQSHLGTLHDADVARTMLTAFLDERRRRAERRGRTPENLEAVAEYLAACETKLQEHLESVPAVWSQLTSPQFRRLFGEATATP